MHYKQLARVLPTTITITYRGNQECCALLGLPFIVVIGDIMIVCGKCQSKYLVCIYAINLLHNEGVDVCRLDLI